MSNDQTLAFSEWRKILPKGVLSSEEANKKYGINTIAAQRIILGGLLPESAEEVAKIVKIASQYHLSLYPLSTGHNWGYGGSTPVQDNCVILDLSNMKRIISIDKVLGLVTLEPGVTQGQLKDYLDQQHINFMVPVTGAGPTCSLLGNALERGYGLNPHTDHFAAVTSIEAILPNGNFYRGALSELGGLSVDRAFKWGVGPYLDGLFSQGNLGIVTAMTIGLVPKPETELGILFNLHSQEELIEVIGPIREILQTMGANMGSIKITNQHRLLAIKEFFPDQFHSKGLLLLDENLNAKLKSKRITKWLGTGAIYGDKKIVAAVKSVIKQKLRGHVHDLFFLNPQTFNRLINFLDLIPFMKNKVAFYQLIRKINDFLALLSGCPNETALPIAYAKSGYFPKAGQALNPDQDACGLIWFAPLIPLHAEEVEIYLTMVNKILIDHHFEPVVTLSSLSSYCFDSAVPILFDKTNPTEVANANACYESLFYACKEKGFLPYRVPIDFMKLIVNENNAYWQLIKLIKDAVDPNHLIAPGRYSL